MVAKKSTEDTPKNLPVQAVDWSGPITWDDVMRDAPEIYSSVDVLGDGATLIQDKSQLLSCGEFMVLDWRIVTDKDTLRDYVSVLCIRRENNQKFRFNDGSTGIKSQLLDYQTRMGDRIVPLHCQGVRVSEYVAELPDGTKSNAKTYYLF